VKIVQKRTRSILTELDELLTHKDKDNLLESRANNIINGAINLIKYIRENYDAESAGELERRLLNAIKGQDPAKFTRGIRRLKDED
jgi:hypothetical protein